MAAAAESMLGWRRAAAWRLTMLLLCAPGAASYSGSCAGHCGSWAEDCWCNDACEAHGNCCTDYKKECGGEPTECEMCDRYTCDEWIEWGAGKYTCESLYRDWKCQCRGCKCSGGAQMSLSMLSADKHPDARCLDGSMAGYYVRHGQQKDKFLLFLEGGGWCYDQDCKAPTADGTLKDCWSRSYGNLGSSKRWPATKPTSYLTGMLSDDVKENPVFSNWTMVYIPYCDGASFTGNREVEGLHFRGEAILKAVLSELETKEDILAASRVVISGGSAGASAVYYHADYIAKRLREGACAPPQTLQHRMLGMLSKATGAGGETDETCTQMEVLALPDAGFFLDIADHDGVRCWPQQMIGLFNVSGGYSSLHAGCLQKYKSEPWRCLFPEYFVDLIQTRLFILNSLYDSSEITYSLGLDCCLGDCPYWKRACTAKELQLYELLRTGHLQGWKDAVQRPGNGVWAIACIDHTLTWGRWTDSTWEVPQLSGHTMAAAVQQWLDWPSGEGNNPPSLLFEDSASWPGNRPCSGQRGRALETTTAASAELQEHGFPWAWSAAAGLVVAGLGLVVVRRPRTTRPASEGECGEFCEMTRTS